MEYILNKTPIRTTNGFRVNDVKVNLEVPTSVNYHDYEILNLDKIKSTVKSKFISNIGLEHDSYKNTDININDQINKIIKVNYYFRNNDSLVDNININIEKDLDINMLINYESKDNNYHFHNGNININIKNNSSLNLTIVCSINSLSVNLLSGVINTSNNSNVKINLIDLSGKTRLYNFKSSTNKNSSSYLNNIYIAKNNSLLDLNYYYINEEEQSSNCIEVQGILDDKAVKTFKGIIDFKKGSYKSNGHENENSLLLSDTCISKSLPILLCHEEDVSGTHSVSSGKIDSNKLFYLMSRSLSEEDAKKLIIKSNFNNILSEIPEEIREEITIKLEEYI